MIDQFYGQQTSARQEQQTQRGIGSNSALDYNSNYSSGSRVFYFHFFYFHYYYFYYCHYSVELE